MTPPQGILRHNGGASGNSVRWLDISTNQNLEDRAGSDRTTPPVVDETQGEVWTPSFRLAMLNIVDARNCRLNAALRCMNQMNIDLGILTEMKLSTDKYTKFAEGYKFVATTADGKKGGVGICYKQSNLLERRRHEDIWTECNKDHTSVGK